MGETSNPKRRGATMTKYIVDITARIVVPAVNVDAAKAKWFGYLTEDDCEFTVLDYDTLEEVEE